MAARRRHPPRLRPPRPSVASLGADGRAVNWTKVFLGFGGMVIGQFMAMLDIQIVAELAGRRSRPASAPAPTRSAGCRPPTCWPRW